MAKQQFLFKKAIFRMWINNSRAKCLLLNRLAPMNLLPTAVFPYMGGIKQTIKFATSVGVAINVESSFINYEFIFMLRIDCPR